MTQSSCPPLYICLLYLHSSAHVQTSCGNYCLLTLFCDSVSGKKKIKRIWERLRSARSVNCTFRDRIICLCVSLHVMCVCVWNNTPFKEREGETDTDRYTERDRQTQTDRETQRQIQRDTEREGRERERERETDRQTDRDREREK